jgi:hypothetical protein
MAFHESNGTVNIAWVGYDDTMTIDPVDFHIG